MTERREDGTSDEDFLYWWQCWQGWAYMALAAALAGMMVFALANAWHG